MRETGPVRKSVDGDPEVSISQIGAARTQLGILKNAMKLAGLQSGIRTISFEDGTQIQVSSVFGQDSISIVTAVSTAPEETQEPPQELLAIDTPNIDATGTSGDIETYSDTYHSAVLLGAITDKTTKTIFLAYAAPSYDQTYCMYPDNMPNFSQLVQLDAKMKEVSRTLIPQPDWQGQFTYDSLTDRFYLNVFNPADSRFQTNANWQQGEFNRTARSTAHRSLLMIDKTGSQTVMAEPMINEQLVFSPAFLWGNIQWVGYPTAISVSPGGGAFNFAASIDENIGVPASFWGAQCWPISQPSTSGLIAVMFPGVVNNSAAGPSWGGGGSRDMYGYALLWSTAAQTIVWRSNSIDAHMHGTWHPDGGLGFFTKDGRVDPWATITPNGNALISVNGALTPVVRGGTLGIGAFPPGIVDIAVTNGDKEAFAITASSAMILHCKNGVWTNVVVKGMGTARAVLHDLVTDAVAVVMDDASGAWIFNGRKPGGAALSPFKVNFKKPPTRNPAMIYPQQFINGVLLITYALPWDGTHGSTGFQFIENLPTPPGYTLGFPYPIGPGPRGMRPHVYTDGQRAPGWRADLGRAGLPDSQLHTQSLGVPDHAADGSLDPLPWVIGRYDIGALKN